MYKRQLCVSDASHLRHHFESRVRDLLNQLSTGVRGTADAATRRILNQAIVLLELGHAIIDLRDLSARLAVTHPARIAKEKCIASLAAYFRRPEMEQHAQALTATQEAGKMLRTLLADETRLKAGEAAQLQRALTDLHMINASLLDPSLSNFSIASTLPNERSPHGASNHAA